MGKLRYIDLKTKERELLSLSSLTSNEFELLVPGFENAFQAHMSKWCLDGTVRTKRRYTTYQNCPLPTAEDRLLFILSYMKNNPLQSNHGLQFGMKQGKTNGWIHLLLPVLRNTLRDLGVAPARSLKALAERLGVTPSVANEAVLGAETPPPLFVMTAQNDALSAPKMRLNRKCAIAARKEPIR